MELLRITSLFKKGVELVKTHPKETAGAIIGTSIFCSAVYNVVKSIKADK